MKKTLTAILAAATTMTMAAAPGQADSAQASAPDDRKAVVQRHLDELTKLSQTGAIARVVQDGRTWTARSGTAVWGKKVPMPVNGHFRIASVTKAFVAAAVLRLAGEGKIDLNGTVDRYLPGALKDGGKITVRMLLRHTSGLSDDASNDKYMSDEGTLKYRYTHVKTDELVKLSDDSPRRFAPGAKHSYSNANYYLLGMLIEKVTGNPWDQEAIRSLGLRATSYPGDKVSLPRPHARGYLWVGGKPLDITRLNTTAAGAAGGLVSTTADLDRFIDRLLSGKLLKPAQMRELLDVMPAAPGEEADGDPGPGIFRYATSCGKQVYGHSGGIAGYVTMVGSTVDRRHRAALNVTMASPDFNDSRLLMKAFDALFCG
ncbi:serine hydrolase domain-containing protein [Nonomuraea typhae]|uniref:serine hydrolase domain-containing protein n=1 Tax=Nonomuraea typhae TaxID=2603600 RepID=UPI0012FC86D7|nr:serine hydrolase domain-containing protein [Nonomuraea typhae]